MLLSCYLTIFFAQNHAAQVFFTRFAPVFRKNRKKSVNFLQFFLSVYQQVRRKLKKKFVKRLDKI